MIIFSKKILIIVICIFNLSGCVLPSKFEESNHRIVKCNTQAKEKINETIQNYERNLSELKRKYEKELNDHKIKYENQKEFYEKKLLDQQHIFALHKANFEKNMKDQQDEYHAYRIKFYDAELAYYKGKEEIVSKLDIAGTPSTSEKEHFFSSVDHFYTFDVLIDKKVISSHTIQTKQEQSAFFEFGSKLLQTAIIRSILKF